MKAAVWHGQKDVRIEDVPEPGHPPSSQVKVEVAWCGICGTDLHEYWSGPVYLPADKPHPLTGVQTPVILGHELSGRVVEVGDRVKKVKVGDRVALCPIIGCLECRWCKAGLMGLCERVAFLGSSWHGGGFARYLNVYEYMCYRLPDSVSDEAGAMVEPWAATVRAVQQAQVKPGVSVAIVGAGPIGLMALQAARIAGAELVMTVEPASSRRELAVKLGATAVADPSTEDPLEKFAQLTAGQGADVVIECVGGEATGLLAGRLTRRRGKMIVMGVFPHPSPLDLTDLLFGEKTIMGSMGGYGVFDDAIRMMAGGGFHSDLMVSKTIRLDDLVDGGLQELVRHRERNLKILVSPT
jgi:(R,R)-butanediol dehydrogenase/meso-butanediol dehydrogenase/diacetyl reductase